MAALEAEMTEEQVAALDEGEHTPTVAEIIERDTEAVEPEAVEPEPDEEPQRVPESSDTVARKLEKALQSEATRHENALKKAYGDDFVDRAFCPCCLGEGFLTPWPSGAMPDEVWEAVQALSGKLDTGELRTPDYIVLCENCGGYGQIDTGAKGSASVPLPCKRCDSRGWFDTEDPIHRAKLGLAPPEPIAPAPAVWSLPAPAVSADAPLAPPPGWSEGGRVGADGFGRWPGHPRYGVDPTAPGAQW